MQNQCSLKTETNDFTFKSYFKETVPGRC